MQKSKAFIFLFSSTFAVIWLIGIASCSQPSGKKKNVAEEYSKTIEHFQILDEIALEALIGKNNPPRDTYLINLKTIALSNWVECVNLFDEAKKLELPNQLEENRMELLKYSNQRIFEAQLFIKTLEEDTDKYQKSIDSIQKEIYELMEKINKKELDTDTINLIPLKKL